MPPFDYVIPFRADGAGVRARNLDSVVRHARTVPGARVTVVEQDDESRWAPPPDVHHVFLRDGGAFVKSWAMNVGARQATTDLIVLGDADLIVRRDHLLRALAAVRADFDVVSPYARLWDLDEGQTAAVRGSGVLPELPGSLRPGERAGEYPPLCGGLFVTRAQVFWDAGGYDEGCRGWGGEDDALSTTLARLAFRCGVDSAGVGLHLWHPRSPDRYRHPGYATNLERLRWIQECPDTALRAWCAEARRRHGDPAGPAVVPAG